MVVWNLKHRVEGWRRKGVASGSAKVVGLRMVVASKRHVEAIIPWLARWFFGQLDSEQVWVMIEAKDL